MPSFTSSGAATVARMQVLADEWGRTDDGRATFLACYQLMTGSMVTALAEHEFADPEWVDQLLGRFVEYYFDALAAYEQDPAAAPAAWRRAHDSCRDPDVWTIQRLLLGINAHINMDLPLTMDELLAPEWAGLPLVVRARREDDFRRVNEIIGRTADTVQDSVLEAAVPSMGVLDVLMGRGDEFLASRLLFRWRENAWENSIRLVEAPDLRARKAVLRAMEDRALHTADAILLSGGPSALVALLT